MPTTNRCDSARASAHGDRPVVLIVDDDPLARALSKAGLDADGFDTHEAENGEDALEVFGRVTPDIVLLDLMMPVMDGYAACEALRARDDGAAVPIIVMTALDDSESVQRAYDLGATDFIIKPVNATLLMHRANYVLRAHRHRVQYDDLTGLPRRDNFLARLEPEFARARRHGLVSALLLLGIDNFERINTSFGHATGDMLLKAYSTRLTSVIRTADLAGHCATIADPVRAGELAGASIARLGGDEFAVALLDIRGAEDAATVAARICDALTSFAIDEQELSLSTSVGISVCPVDSEGPEVLLKHAGTALGHAKVRGGSQVQFYTESLNTRARRRYAIESGLRRALERDELRLHYQPQIELSTQALVGTEALLRWRSAELGEVSPAEFVPIAEEAGLMREITEWTLEEACRYMAGCHEEGLVDISVSVNLSAVQFKESGTAEAVARIVDASGLASKYVKLELTETALFDDIHQAIATLEALREHGFEIEVDDFGTGYSSLSYLTRLPVSTLKIDRAFVGKSTLSETDAAVVNVIIGLGHTLGHRIIAEGLESIEQIELLTRSGCDVGQGFVFSRPLAAEHFRGWARRWRERNGFGRERAADRLRSVPLLGELTASTRDRAA